MWVNIYSDSLCTLREGDKVNYLTLRSFISPRSSFCAKRGVSSFIFMFCCSPQTSIMNGIVWARAPDQCRISGPTHTLYRFREIKNTQAFSVITTFMSRSRLYRLAVDIHFEGCVDVKQTKLNVLIMMNLSNAVNSVIFSFIAYRF
jgi:hypothetical protein